MDAKILKKFEAIVGPGNLLADPEDIISYECDAYAFHRHKPDAVLLISTREQVVEAIRVACEYKIPFVPRGSGTGLSGGALPRFGGIVLVLTRMKAILEVDYENRQVVAEPGVINAEVSQATEAGGYFFAPDPSSQAISTVGGNLAENAGGPHCLKYGMTANHILSLEVVMPSGDTLEFGSRAADCPGYDLVGAFVGSEGTFGVATRAVLKLVPLPQEIKTMFAAFPSIKDACDAVTGIIARGIVPAALEMMDRRCIHAVEASVNRAGLPLDAEAVLIIELDGLPATLGAQADEVMQICRNHHSQQLQLARNEAERQAIWKGRKHAFGAAGRMTRDLYLQDAAVPRNRLSEVVVKLYEIADRWGFALASLIHAGDGNMHPLLLFDRSKPGQEERVLEAAREMLQTCINAGGTLSGEHGIGSEKSEYMSMLYSEADLDAMKRLRVAFNPDELCNPGKIFPLRRCGYEKA